MNLPQLFCKHKYDFYAKKLYEYEETEILPDTKYWARPKFQTQQYSETVEVLICNKCGLVKRIEY